MFFQKSEELVSRIITIVTGVRKLKTSAQLSLKIPLASLTIYVENNLLRDALSQHNQLLRGVTHAQEINYEVVKLDKPEIKIVDGFWHAKVNS